jgi:transcriptional regulator with XRE-family HTH domain
MASFGQFIRTEREKCGLTQTELGAKIGINTSAISRIENGSQKFSKKKLDMLSNIFGIEAQVVRDLFFADKFAKEAYVNKCSPSVFTVAEETAKYIRLANSKQAKLEF